MAFYKFVSTVVKKVSKMSYFSTHIKVHKMMLYCYPGGNPIKRNSYKTE